MNSVKRKVFINISDVASYIGQNKWSMIDPFQRIWKKADTNYNDCLNILNNNIIDNSLKILVIEKEKSTLEDQLNNKVITKRQFNSEVKKVEKKIQETKIEKENLVKKIENVTLTQTEKIEKEIFIASDATLANVITETIASKSTDTKDKRKTVNDSIDKLYSEGKIKEDRRIELLKNTESLINVCHGTLKEQSAIDIFENKFNVTLDISQKYHKYLVKSTSDIDWYVGGKLDGICKEQSFIVEVKNRTKGFFSSVRDYELTQIQLYLLLTGYTESKLVEKFGKNIRVTDIPIDNTYISEVLSYLCMFIDSMESFIKNDSLKMKYLNFENDTDKQKLLNKLYLDKITKQRFEDEERKIIKNENQDYMSDLDSDDL